MKKSMIMSVLLVLLAAAPALAHDQPALEHEHELNVTDIPPPEPTPSPAPTATPMPPLCSETNPSLTRCLAVMDPAQALNQRVTQLEQREAQIIQALQQLAQKVDVKKDAKK